ncbi:DUF6479 family protein [Streptomyces sp. NPDC001941]|uniref:DUF6479 family protein n=1 Tax=Streptomyces sp. NPDC001941 TaxID=3154659 RepID=UPI003319A134
MNLSLGSLGSHGQLELASSSSTSLWLIVIGVVVVVALLAAFVYGSRRTRQRAARDVRADPAAGSAPDQRGKSWQTIDDDPDQGNPHR